jgi:hypothetical protein
MVSKDWRDAENIFNANKYVSCLNLLSGYVVHSAGILTEEKSCVFNEISVVAIFFLSYVEK